MDATGIEVKIRITPLAWLIITHGIAFILGAVVFKLLSL